MARPKKKGPAVSFRLTLESHEIMETKAAEKGLTLNVYLASILERAAQASKQTIVIQSTNTNPTAVASTASWTKPEQ